MNDSSTLDVSSAPATPSVSAAASYPIPAAFVAQGTGKAFQSVAQSMAIAVQDATDGLRNSTTMANTAMGVALAQFLATKDAQYLQTMQPAQDMVKAAATTLASVGATATTLLKAFPTGSS